MDFAARSEAARERAERAHDRAKQAEDRATELLRIQAEVPIHEASPSTLAQSRAREAVAHGESERLHLEAADLHEEHARHAREAGDEETARDADARADVARGRAKKAAQALKKMQAEMKASSRPSRGR